MEKFRLVSRNLRQSDRTFEHGIQVSYGPVSIADARGSKLGAVYICSGACSSKSCMGYRTAIFWINGGSARALACPDNWCGVVVRRALPNVGCEFSPNVTSEWRNIDRPWHCCHFVWRYFSVLARNVAQKNHTMVFGIGTAAGSMGMFLLSPISVGLIDQFGWSDTLVIFAVVMMVIPFLGLALVNKNGNQTDDKNQLAQTTRQALKEAFGHRSYVYLTTGFFVCGFQLAFITVHFPAYIQDIGVDAKYAGYALAMIGLFNVVGSLASGVLGQKYSKPILLAWIYIARSIVTAGFILLPQSATTVIIFSMLMGLLWLSTVAPTNALVAVMFGTKHLGLLSGMIFVSHQVGSFLGVWLGGILYDIYGNFDLVWWIAIVLGLFAAAIHWPISEKAVTREAVA